MSLCAQYNKDATYVHRGLNRTATWPGKNATQTLALGSNAAGQLGIGHQNDISIPEQCIFSSTAPLSNDETITSLQAGGNHTLLLTSSGRVFATGSRETLPVKAEGAAELNTFRLLDIKKVFGLPSTSNITQIAASWDASYFVVDERVVYACGIGNKGELGLGEEKPFAVTPEVVIDLGMYGDGSETIKDISAGMSHVVLVTSNGEIYGWGTSRKGELREAAKEKKIIWGPRKIGIDFSARSAVAGRNFTFIQGTENQQALLGNAKQLPSGELLELSAETEVTCGWSNLYALDAGELQAVGRNDRGQVPLIKLSQLKLFAAGSEHGVGCTVGGEVVTFGWGEHGNCGEPVDGKGNVAGRFNTIAITKNDDEHVCFLAAGCATTFIAVKSSEAPD